MAGQRQARKLSRRPAVVTAILLTVSLMGAAWPVPASSRVPTPDPRPPAPVRDVDSLPPAPAPVGGVDSLPPAPVRGVDSLIRRPAQQSRPAPIVDVIPDREAPGRPVVSIPQVEPVVTIRAGPGSTAVFLGDSFTSGWNGAGLGANSWPRLVGISRAWRVVNLAVAGTGFINPGWTNQPIGSLAAKAVRQRPDVIVIAAGHNDSRWAVAAVARAADEVIDKLHAAAPEAVLVVVAPIWQNGSPPARCLALRDHLREKAASIDAVFVDPLAEHWFSGSGHRFIGPDGLHPTNAGHRFVADRVLAAMGG